MRDLDEPVHLAPYDPSWPDLFRSEAERLRTALPVENVIEHIGSTAVPGLVAKPIIDIMVGIDPHHDLEDVRSVIGSLGYEDLGEAGVPGRVYFRKRSATAFNAHLTSLNGPIWCTNLAFRDYLRTNPEAAHEYAEAKTSAVESGAGTLLAYSDRKGEMILRLLRRLETTWF